MQQSPSNETPDLLICFDESGKQNSDPIQLMGAFSIPKNIYMHPQYEALHSLNMEYHFHWTEYGGDSRHCQYHS